MWEQDISYYGHFNISNINKQHYSVDFLENNNFYRSEDNPYIQTFWKWFPDLIQELQILRITGGEPLLHSNTFLLLDKIDEYPNPNLTISINSNLGVTNRRIQNLCQRMRKLKIDKKIKRFRIFTSIDTWGPKAEYIRTGLDLSLWEKNLYTILDAGFEVMLMCTYNVLSVTSFTSLLEKIVKWRSKFGFNAIRFDAPYLRNPSFWSICILPSDFDNYIYQSIRFIIDNQSKFRDDEFTRVDRLLAYKKMNSFTDPNLSIYKQDFYKFFSVMDQRNNTDFCSVFPEYINFYNSARIAI
jgi:organic radical activating enzyme